MTFGLKFYYFHYNWLNLYKYFSVKRAIYLIILLIICISFNKQVTQQEKFNAFINTIPDLKFPFQTNSNGIGLPRATPLKLIPEAVIISLISDALIVL